MKRLLNSKKLSGMAQKFIFALAIAFGSVLTSIQAFAQDAPEKVDVDINTDGGAMWYGQPWVWAVGVAIFIVIIVAITRSNTNRNA